MQIGVFEGGGSVSVKISERNVHHQSFLHSYTCFETSALLDGKRPLCVLSPLYGRLRRLRSLVDSRSEISNSESNSE